jgi:hypothetical protein
MKRKTMMFVFISLMVISVYAPTSATALSMDEPDYTGSMSLSGDEYLYKKFALTDGQKVYFEYSSNAQSGKIRAFSMTDTFYEQFAGTDSYFFWLQEKTTISGEFYEDADGDETFYMVVWNTGTSTITVNYCYKTEEPTIPGYDLFFLIGISAIISLLIVRKTKKKMK